MSDSQQPTNWRSPHTPQRATTPRPTMAEIADAAGVSIPTVSKVINNRSDVAPETRARVEQIIAQRGYVTNKAAQSLWTGRSYLIDLVVYDLNNDYDFAIIRGVEQALEGARYRVAISAAYGEDKRERQWLSKVLSGSTDGAILVLASEHSPHLEELRRQGIPFVVIDSRGELPPNTPSVGATNWAGARTATDYLLTLGHRRIALLGGPMSFISAQARLAGFRAAHEMLGVPVIPELIRPGRYVREDGYTQTHLLLDLPDPPTAIFAGNDMQALGVYRALRERGVTIPDHISVVGFDNEPLASEISPPLTTVHQPLAEMGRLAAAMLMRLLAGEPLDAPRVEVATTLEIRASCAPPRAQPLTPHPR